MFFALPLASDLEEGRRIAATRAAACPACAPSRTFAVELPALFGAWAPGLDSLGWLETALSIAGDVRRRAFAFLMHWMSPTGEDRYDGRASDERWVLPAGLGPDQLVSELTERFWDRLRFFAMRRLRDKALAEDVAQETLRRTLESLRAGRVEKPEALPAFLFETARHVCMHRSRSFGREARAYQRVASESEEVSGVESDPLAALITDERCEQVRDCMERLGESDRALLAMSYDESLDAEAIGQRLGITAGAVRVRRHRALARLAELMGVTKRPERERLR
jgi:RNA polymerase sigma-70 factor (ECF subfamily)